MAQVTDVPFGNYYALIIANSNYASHGEWDTLTGPPADAAALKNVLESEYGFKVQLIEDVTRNEIVDTLYAYDKVLTEADNLLIYYAGHGQMRGDQGYWIGIDGAKGSPSGWLSGSELATYLNEIEAKHVLVVADSCFAGTLLRGGDGDTTSGGDDRLAFWRRMAVVRTRLALVSGNLERVLDGGGPNGLSIFAFHFINALSNNEDVLATHTLFEEIKVPVLNASAARLEPELPAQQPDLAPIWKANHVGGDFLFVRKGFSTTPSVAAPRQVARINFGIRGDFQVVSPVGARVGRRVEENPLAERLDRLLMARFLVANDLLLRLDGGAHQIFETSNLGGELESHSAVVLHFTASDTVRATLAALGGDTPVRASAHLVVDRDGSTTQLLPFDMKAWHAGRSELTMLDGRVLNGLNAHSIGIELVNNGRLTKVDGGWRPAFGPIIKDSSRVFLQPDGSAWEAYTPEQIDVVSDILKGLVATYGIEMVVGHQDITPRKLDPGPAFPMKDVMSRVFGPEAAAKAKVKN